MKHVDVHGLASLSMRVLGAELGVDATALYRHFPNKDSLVEAMVDVWHTLGINFVEPPTHLHVDEKSAAHCAYPEIKLAAQ